MCFVRRKENDMIAENENTGDVLTDLVFKIEDLLWKQDDSVIGWNYEYIPSEKRYKLEIWKK